MGTMTDVSEISSGSAITAAEWDAWRAFYAMRRRLDRTLERQLQGDSDISTPDYEVLLAIFTAPDRQVRTRELTRELDCETSRVSHQVTRMEKRGLVERTECDSDARGTWIGLTAAGSRAVLGAMRGHAASIRRYFFDVLTPEELATLAAASTRVLEALEPTTDCEPDNPDEGAGPAEPESAPERLA